MIVVTGAAGMLGQDVVSAAGDGAVALSRADLDVTDAGAAREALDGADVVINCAAWTDVDGAEEHAEEALAVNREGARNVAAAARRVVYVSTDYVFDGAKRAPYVESDPTAPLQSYGRSKLAGELATAEANPRHFIVRSSWLFGAGGGNFVETMLRLGRERAELRVVDDQVGCPTFTGHLAEAIVALALSARWSPAPLTNIPCPPTGRRGQCSAASAAARCLPGRRAWTPTWVCAREAARHRSRGVHRLDVRAPPA